MPGYFFFFDFVVLFSPAPEALSYFSWAVSRAFRDNLSASCAFFFPDFPLVKFEFPVDIFFVASFTRRLRALESCLYCKSRALRSALALVASSLSFEDESLIRGF